MLARIPGALELLLILECGPRRVDGIPMEELGPGTTEETAGEALGALREARLASVWDGVVRATAWGKDAVKTLLGSLEN